MSSFMASQDARISMFEADFKQYQSEMTDKMDAFLKAFNNRMTRSLSCDTINNPKLNPNSTSSARSYPAGDPQSSSKSFKSVNSIQTCFKSTTNIQKDQLQVNTLMVNEIETPKPKETKESLEDEFTDLHLNLLVLKVLAHVLIYDALLDKYIVSLELGKNGSAFIESVVSEKIKYFGLFILPYKLGDSKPFNTLTDLGLCVNLIPLSLFKNLKIGLLEEIEDVLGLADGTKSYPVGIVENVEVHVVKLRLFEDFHVVDMEREPTCPLLIGRGFLATVNAVIDRKKAKIAVGEGLTRPIFGVRELDFEWDIARDAKVNPFKDILVFRKMVEFLGVIPINLKGNMWESEDLVENNIDSNRPPKEGDGAWHVIFDEEKPGSS
ncbi:DNA-directed DNA polymerase [Tanacetum coccineum]